MDTNLAYCHVVASVLAADGLMADGERAFLARVMEEMKLTAEQREQVTHFEGADGAENIVRRMNRADREHLRDELLGATLVDGNISPLESKLVAHLTQALGL